MKKLLLTAVAAMAVLPAMAENQNLWTGEQAVTWRTR